MVPVLPVCPGIVLSGWLTAGPDSPVLSDLSESVHPENCLPGCMRSQMYLVSPMSEEVSLTIK